MNKKLLAAAVAGALAAPGVALAQVTISGVFKVGIDQFKVGNAVPGARLNDSAMRISDNSSAIHFNVTEDLGGGLAAIAKLDVRFRPDEAGNGSNVTAAGTGTVGGTSNPIGTGNTWVGLRSTSWGAITMGRWDLHYGAQPNDVATKGALMASSVSLMDFVGAGTTTSAIANATRTQNVVKWDSPNWGGFTVTAAYSTSPLSGSEGDMSATNAAVTTARKGSGYNLQGTYNAANWQLGGSLWDAKSDATLTGQALANDQASTSVYGFIMLGSFKVGGAFKMDERKNPLTGVKVNDRDAQTLNLAYFMGPHTFAGHYTMAGEDKAPGFAAVVSGTKAKMMAFAYSYDLSKRTAVSLTYAKIDNGTNSAYNLFTNTSLGSADAGVTAGEDPNLMALTVRHTF